MDEREIERPETLYSRDIEDDLFQSIVQNCIQHIAGVSLVEGKPSCSFFGRAVRSARPEITVEQNTMTHSVSVTVNLNIEYGLSIPAKSEEIQEAIVQELTEHTGLHVGSVHVIFRNLISTLK